MNEREQLIERFIPKLREAMLVKAGKNDHKPSLTSLSIVDLRRGREDESEEVELDLLWIRRFQRSPVSALLEVADYCMYAAEDLRRVGALEEEEEEVAS